MSRYLRSALLFPQTERILFGRGLLGLLGILFVTAQLSPYVGPAQAGSYNMAGVLGMLGFLGLLTGWLFAGLEMGVRGRDGYFCSAVALTGYVLMWLGHWAGFRVGGRPIDHTSAFFSIAEAALYIALFGQAWNAVLGSWDMVRRRHRT